MADDHAGAGFGEGQLIRVELRNRGLFCDQAHVIRRMTGVVALSLLVVPGVYFLVAGQGIGGNLGVWDFQSGMEAGLVIALTGWLALLVSCFRPENTGLRQWLALGGVLALIMFARLDEVFDIATVGIAWLLWRRQPLRLALVQSISLGLPAALLLALYFAFNLATVGVLMPVSGAAKAGVSLLQNGWVSAVNLFPPIFDLREALTSYTGNRAVIAAATFRSVELLLPALFAAVAIILIWTRLRAHRGRCLRWYSRQGDLQFC